MSFIKTTTPSGEEVKLHYQDLGKGQPVVLIHGWPSSKEMFEYQVGALVGSGFRVIAYDRRGFGRSCKPWDGYDYDTLATDLKTVLDELDLQDVTLIGFSMGGGEVARYFSKYGGARVKKAVLISTVLPYLQQAENNPDGVPKEVFAGIMDAMKEDRIAFLEDFGKAFFGVNLVKHSVSGPSLEYYRRLCEVASPRATQQCAVAFAGTDFRTDVPKINVPTLIIHGDADKTVPIANSSDRTAKMIPGAKYLVYEGSPHGLFHTDKDRLNEDLLNFLRQ